MSTMRIRHVSSDDGKLHYLQAHNGTENYPFGIAMVEPGVYPRGKVSRRQIIRLVFGELEINGKRLYDVRLAEIVEVGQDLVITANSHAAYYTQYED